MARTKVTTPDGKSFTITHKEGVSNDVLLSYVNNVAYPTEAAKEKGAFDFAFDAEAKFRSDVVEGTEASVGGVQQLFANTWRKTKDLYYDNVEAGLNLVGKLDAKTREELKVARQRATRSIDLYEEIADLQREPMRKLGKAIEDSRYMQQDNAISQGALEVIGTIGYMTPMLAAGIATRGGSFPRLVAAAQATEEAVGDMENALGKDQSEFTNEEKNQLADVSSIYALGSALLANMPIKALGLDKLGPGTFGKFLRGETKLPAGALFRTLKAGAAESLEESAQGQFLDTLARFSYDDDRQLVGREVLKDRLHEATIAFFAGGAIRGSGEVVGAIGNIKMPTPKREALSEEEVGNKKKFNVKYKRTQKAVGKADEVFDEESPFYAETLEEAKEIAQNTLGEQDGIDVDSITVEEFIEPTVQPEVKEDVDFIPDYSDAKVGDTIKVFGVDGKESDVEVTGISDAGTIKYKRADGTEGILGSESDAVLYDINSSNYETQGRGTGFSNRKLSDMSDAELEQLSNKIDEDFKSGAVPTDINQGPVRDRIADRNAVKLEQKRRKTKTSC